MSGEHGMTAAEFERLLTALRDPDYVARLAADARTQGLLEVDNPLRREVRPRRGTESHHTTPGPDGEGVRQDYDRASN